MGSPAVWPDQEKHPQEEPPEMRQREDEGSQAGKGGQEVGGDRRSARGAWRQAREPEDRRLVYRLLSEASGKRQAAMTPGQN